MCIRDRREAGIAVFGPDAQGAQLEGSKTFSKRFMDAHGNPTARYGSFDDREAALGYLSALEAPATMTPLPAARPSAFTTTGASSADR